MCLTCVRPWEMKERERKRERERETDTQRELTNTILSFWKNHLLNDLSGQCYIEVFRVSSGQQTLNNHETNNYNSKHHEQENERSPKQ
jgi:hypothetical protein